MVFFYSHGEGERESLLSLINIILVDVFSIHTAHYFWKVIYAVKEEMFTVSFEFCLFKWVVPTV